MKVKSEPFGQLPNGTKALLFTFNTERGLIVRITNYGGIIISIEHTNKNGKLEEITAGFPNLEKYLVGHPHFGVIVGRYANRIAHGKFTIDGETFNLPINNPPNHLHGGDQGFHTKLWEHNLKANDQKAELTLKYHSPHSDEGYPGSLKVTVTYTISNDNSIGIDFEAEADKKTHVNLTSHCYFNLNGFSKSIGSHTLFLASNSYLPVDNTQIPTGTIAPTHGTDFDLSQPTEIGKILQKLPGGLDHCYVLTPNQKPAATLYCNESGRKLSLFCSQPGIQVYTGNFLDGSITGHNGIKYQKQWAICLEPQHFPDTPNKPNFPSTLLSPNQIYKHRITMYFSNE